MRIKFIQIIIDFIRQKNKKDTNLIPNETNYPICLSENEQKFFLKHIKDCKNYLEFGLGGSTFLALLKTQIAKITSIESDTKWIEHIKQWGCIKEAITNKRLNIRYIDIGNVGEWSYPLEYNKSELFKNYTKMPFESQDCNFDIVFTDGRFRVACMLSAILHLNKNTKLLLHDFNNREHYHCILSFLDIIDTCDLMALFKIKDNVNYKKVQEMYDEYKNNPD